MANFYEVKNLGKLFQLVLGILERFSDEVLRLVRCDRIRDFTCRWRVKWQDFGLV